MSGITRGNFVGQPGGIFPIDVETFQQLQDYVDAVGGIVSILEGIDDKQDGVILNGCELSSDGLRRSSGWLVLTGQDKPRLVYYEGGNVADGITEVREDVVISYNGVDYKAYERTVARAGEGVDPGKNYRWSDIAERVTLNDVISRIKSVEEDYPGCVPPIGSILLWGGESETMNSDRWLLCDGRHVAQEEYKALYSVIGGTYNGASIVAGHFRLPDLKQQIEKDDDTFVDRRYIIRAK